MHVGRFLNFIHIELDVLTYIKILHALHTLQQEIVASMEGCAKPKTAFFDERTYGQYYRGFMNSLKKYHRLGELRRFHMHYLL